MNELAKGFFMAIVSMAILLGISYIIYNRFFKQSSEVNIEATTIQKSIAHISKLMVIEGYFSEVYNYQEKTKVFFNLISQEKKALIILNAKAQVGYDLKKVEILVDQKRREVIIKSIPPEEINISPELKFYDIQSSTFTSFSSDDLNKVQKDAHDRIMEQIEKSDIKQQARERLIDNLQSVTAVSQAMGWKMIDNTKVLPQSLSY